jgi:hypothetical protein
VGHLEPPESTRTLGVRLTLRHPLTVELRHLLDQIVIVQQDRSIRTNRQRMLIALHRDTGIRRRRFGLNIGHCHAFRF